MEPEHEMRAKTRSTKYKIVWIMNEPIRFRYSGTPRIAARRNTNFVQHVMSDVVLRSGDSVEVIMDDDSRWMGHYNGRVIICMGRPRGSGAGQTLNNEEREPDNKPSNNEPVRIEVVERRHNKYGHPRT